VRIDLYFPLCTTVSYLLTYLLATRRVPGYPLSYPAGYPGNELPDNGSPTRDASADVQCLWTSLFKPLRPSGNKLASEAILV